MSDCPIDGNMKAEDCINAARVQALEAWLERLDNGRIAHIERITERSEEKLSETARDLHSRITRLEVKFTKAIATMGVKVATFSAAAAIIGSAVVAFLLKKLGG